MNEVINETILITLSNTDEMVNELLNVANQMNRIAIASGDQDAVEKTSKIIDLISSEYNNG
jgi:hypothetical protein